MEELFDKSQAAKKKWLHSLFSFQNWFTSQDTHVEPHTCIHHYVLHNTITT